MRAARDTWLNPAGALLLCAAGGATAAWLRTPLPWMLGPMLAMAACNFGGLGLRAPRAGRPAGQLVIGCALGLYFTPAVARELASYWHLLLIAALLAIVLGWLCGWIVARLTGTDSTTAFFASVPGGAAEMMVLGERFGARADRIALAQSLRILIVIIVVPVTLTLSGVHGADAYTPTLVAFDWAGLGALAAIALAAAAALWAVRLPNAFMLGPLFAAIALTASEVQLSSVPTGLTNAAQLLIGCTLGARFERRSLASVPGYVGGVLASIAVAIVLAAACAVALAWGYGLPAPSLVLATAPGGIAEMCITAKVLQLGVPLVTAAQVTRVIVLITTTAPTFRAVRALGARRKAG